MASDPLLGVRSLAARTRRHIDCVGERVTMSEPLHPSDLAALLSVVHIEPDVLLRIAALDAATRFALDPAAWLKIATANWEIVNSEPVGSPARREALALAVRIPLWTLRDYLRRMATDKEEPDRDAIADALDQAGDPSRILPLIEATRKAGGSGRFRDLAGMPVEDVVTSRDLPPLPPGGRSDFWRAMVLARLGEFGPLDAYLSGQAPEPDLFWGSPWTAYDEIARIRPVPEPMRAHLLEALSRLDPASRSPGTASVGDHERLVRLVAWAATGIADAEGSPIAREAPSPSHPPASPAPSSAQVARALAVRARLPGLIFERGDTPPELEALRDLPSTEVAGLVRDVVAEGNQRTLTRPPHQAFEYGNGIVSCIAYCPVTDDWPSAELVAMQLRAQHPALDDAQLAWVIGRDRARHLIEELSGLLTSVGPRDERLRILRLLGAAADWQGERRGSPVRGAGPGATTPTGRGALLDDSDELHASLGRRELVDDRRRTRSSNPPELEAVQAEGPVTPARAENRTVNAEILCSGQRRTSFVAGADNVIRCWIGLPGPDAASANLGIPEVAIPRDGLPLVVQMLWRDSNGEEHADHQSMLLPADRTARSGDCDLRLCVPPGERYVAAEIVFRFRGRVFEIVRLEAFALAPGEAQEPQHAIKITVQASRRDVIDIVDSRPVHDVFVFGDRPTHQQDLAAPASPSLLQFGKECATRLALGDSRTAIQWLNKQLHATETLVVRRHARATLDPAKATSSGGSELAEELDASDPDVRRLLRDMARHGAGLYQQLVEQEGFTDPGDRIQVINWDSSTYAPLEFVYDRGYPVSNAPLCTAGLAALTSEAGTCPVCRLPATAETRDSAPVICPLGFWSLRKIIERVAVDGAANPSAPRIERRSLPAIDSVVFASSHIVPEDERTATQAALRQRFAQLYLAEDWNQWKEAVAHHPSLLLVLPHHGVQAALDYLEIGDEQLSEELGKLSRGQIGRQYINPEGREPGPIVLLLGCQTGAETETGYVQMTQRIQQQRASIVVGTLAEILGRHAAPVARALVAELAAIDDPGADFGTIMRRVRRHMLARGYLLALCLVAFGDAEWRLTPRPGLDDRSSREGSHASH